MIEEIIFRYLACIAAGVVTSVLFIVVLWIIFEIVNSVYNFFKSVKSKKDLLIGFVIAFILLPTIGFLSFVGMGKW